MQPSTPSIQMPALPGLGNTNPAANVPLTSGPSAWDRDSALKARRDSTGVGDVVKSVWRQDSIVDGLMASIVGNSMAPDPAWNPYAEADAVEATKGIDPKYHHELYRSTSRAHREFIRQRLLDKQEDTQRLDDLGLAGNVGRIALNVLMPENYIFGLGAGAAARGVGKGMLLGLQGIERAAAQASARASMNASKAVGAGLGVGFAENAAYEYFRQGVNFEDDSFDVMLSGLVGTAFTAPFALAGAKQAGRASASAKDELEVLQALKAASDGRQITPEQAAKVDRTFRTHRAITELEAGRITSDEFDSRVAEMVGPVEPPDVWMARYGDRVRNDAQTIIDELFPGSKDPKVPNVPVPDARKAQLDARMDAETVDILMKRDQTPTQSVRAQVARLSDLQTDAPAGPETAMSLAMKRAVEKDGLPSGTSADDAFAQMEAQRAAEMEAAWARAESEATARRAKEEDSAVNQRELGRMLEEDPIFAGPDMGPPKPPESAAADTVPTSPVADAPPRAPEAPPVASAAAPATTPSPEAPKAPASTAVGPAKGMIAAAADNVREFVADTLKRLKDYYNIKDLKDLDDALVGSRTWFERLEQADEMDGSTSRIMRDKNINDSLQRLRDDVESLNRLGTLFPKDVEAARARHAMYNGKGPLGPSNMAAQMAHAMHTDGIPGLGESDWAERIFKGVVKNTAESLRDAERAMFSLTKALSDARQSLLSKNGRIPNKGTSKHKEWVRLDDMLQDRKDQWNLLQHRATMAERQQAAWDAEGTRLDAPKAPEQAALPAPEAPKAPDPTSAESFVGKVVSWADPKTGDHSEGKVMRVSPTGKLVIEDEMGQMRAVPHTILDQFPQGAPSGFLPGSVGAAQVQRIVGVWEQQTAMSKARLDYFAILNRSESLGVRQMAWKMMKDAIRVDKDEAQGWTASEYKKQLVRTLGGNFHRALDDALREAYELAQVPMLKRGAFKEEFYKLVARETRGDFTVKARNKAIYPAISKASAAMKEAYTKALEEAQRHRVKGAMDVPPKDTYVNRVWDQSSIREKIAEFGEDNVVALLARAINVPGFIGDRVKSAAFLRAVRRLEFEDGRTQLHLQGRDMGTLRQELAGQGLKQDEIDAVVEAMFDARAGSGGDAGQAGPNLKFRFDLEENAAVNIPGKGVLRISDLLENDSRVLVDTYLNAMGGHIGFAKVGIDSEGTFEAALKRIGDEAIAQNLDGARIAKELGYLRDVRKHILGRPMSTQDFSNTARVANALRGYTRAATLGQLGLVSAFELHKAVVMMGLRAVWQSSPAFRDIITAMRRGYVPNSKLAQDIMDMSGFGTEMAHSYSRIHELESGYADGMVSRMERGANSMSHAVDIISGNSSITSITRSMAAQAAARQAHQWALTGKALSKKARERMVTQGLDDAEIDVVLGDLKNYSTHSNGRLEGIDYENWQKNDRDTYDKFTLYISRQAREAIQDQDIGETMPWMHTTLGKVFAELRTFMLVGHAKTFLKNLELRDSTALQIFMFGAVAESLAYTLQMAMNKPDELDQRLAPDEMARAVFQRMAALGIVSTLYGTGYEMVTGESFAKPGSTANTDSRNILKTASYNQLNRLVEAMKSGAATVTGSNEVTQREFSDSVRALPFSRLYGAPALIEELSNYFPKSDPSMTQGAR